MRSVIAATVARVLTPVVLLLAAYLLLRGHQAPGGGFPAGLLLGLWLAFGEYATGGEADAPLRASAGHLVGWGLVLALGTGLAPLVAGRDFLDMVAWRPHVPGVGQLDVTSALVFETGIVLIVVGLVAAVIQELRAQ